MSLRLSRRTFLGGLLAAAATAAIGLRWWQVRRQPEFPAARLVELLTHRDSAVLLGRRYRAAVPGEDGKAPLVAALAATFGSADALPPDQDGLRRVLAERIREDFTAGRMVAVDDWLLAVTEARLCALASLDVPA